MSASTFSLVLAPLVLGVGAFFEQLLRYVVPALLLCGAFHFVPSLRDLRIQPRAWERRALWRDFGASVQFSVVAAAAAAIVAFATLLGETRIYVDVSDYGEMYLVASFLMALFISDTYFYWTHRLMHWRPLFKVLHARHHEARTPSPWSAFAFHPTESMVQAAIYPIIAFVLPIHVDVFMAFLAYSAMHSALIHCGHDLLHVREHRRWSRALYTTVDHDLHHLRGRGAYGLHFSFWDAVMGTRAEIAPLRSPDASHPFTSDACKRERSASS